jgi:hypothetical protein
MAYHGSNSLSLPFGTLASAGPDVHVSMLVEAMKSWSLSGAPGLEISLTSFNVIPVVSPSPLVEEMTPSYREAVLVRSVIVVP